MFQFTDELIKPYLGDGIVRLSGQPAALRETPL
jgi:hypothetical protein